MRTTTLILLNSRMVRCHFFLVLPAVSPSCVSWMGCVASTGSVERGSVVERGGVVWRVVADTGSAPLGTEGYLTKPAATTRTSIVASTARTMRSRVSMGCCWLPKPASDLHAFKACWVIFFSTRSLCATRCRTFTAASRAVRRDSRRRWLPCAPPSRGRLRCWQPRTCRSGAGAARCRWRPSRRGWRVRGETPVCDA